MYSNYRLYYIVSALCCYIFPSISILDGLYIILNIFDFQDAKNGAEIKAVDAYCWLHATVHLDSALLRKLSTLPRIRTPCRGFLPDLSSPDTNILSNDILHNSGFNNGLQYQPQPQQETLYYQWVPFFLLFQVRKLYINQNLFAINRTREKRKIRDLYIL